MRVTTRRSALVVSALLLGVSALAACGSSSSKSTTSGSLEDRAEAEGGPYIYSVLQEGLNAELQAAWEKKYPDIPLTIEKIAGASINARYEAEASAGAVKADAAIISDCSFVDAQTKSGNMTPMNDADIADYASFPQDFQLDGGAVPIIQTNPWGIGYNTNKVKDADAPKSWEDLLDPKWKGKILAVSPRSSTANMQAWDFLIETYGADFVKKLAAQATQFYPSTGPGISALFAGEGSILIPGAGQGTAPGAVEGAPGGFVLPDDTTASYICTGVSSKAPHPSAAKLFTEFLLSKDGNASINPAELFAAGPFGDGVALPTGYKAADPLGASDVRSDEVAKIVGVK